MGRPERTEQRRVVLSRSTPLPNTLRPHTTYHHITHPVHTTTQTYSNAVPPYFTVSSYTPYPQLPPHLLTHPRRSDYLVNFSLNKIPGPGFKSKPTDRGNETVTVGKPCFIATLSFVLRRVVFTSVAFLFCFVFFFLFSANAACCLGWPTAPSNGK